MDLGTVLNKLKRGEYNSPAEMAADVRLTFDNAMKYNRDDSSIHQISKNLKAVSILIPLSQTETNTQNCFQLFTTISLFFLCLFRDESPAGTNTKSADPKSPSVDSARKKARKDSKSKYATVIFASERPTITRLTL